MGVGFVPGVVETLLVGWREACLAIAGHRPEVRPSKQSAMAFPGFKVGQQGSKGLLEGPVGIRGATRGQGVYQISTSPSGSKAFQMQ